MAGEAQGFMATLTARWKAAGEDAGRAGFIRQLVAFLGVSVVATICDYSVMLGAREIFLLDAVIAALAGYAFGGLVSYLLNRRHTFDTERTHFAAGWRFMSVMAVGFTLTGLLMALFTDYLALPYLPARVVTTLMVFGWNFFAHRLWSFDATR